MEYPITNQVKAKAEISVDDFIMFVDNNGNLDSGTVIARNGDHISVLFENEDRADDIIEYGLDEITIYRDKDSDDIK